MKKNKTKDEVVADNRKLTKRVTQLERELGKADDQAEAGEHVVRMAVAVDLLNQWARSGWGRQTGVARATQKFLST